MTQEILKYAEEAKALDIRGYKSTPEEDFMLYLWWTEMRASGELSDIFSTSCQSLGNFSNSQAHEIRTRTESWG